MELHGYENNDSKFNHQGVEVTSKKALKVAITDQTGKQWEMDNLTYAGIVIDGAHHELHEGNMFEISGAATLASGAILNILIDLTNNTVPAHIIFSFRSTGEMNVQLFEDVVVSANGVAISAINRNRLSANISQLKAYTAPTITNTGSLLTTAHFGNGNNIGGESRANNEWILAHGKKYLIRITSEAAGNDISYMHEYYEHYNVLG